MLAAPELELGEQGAEQVGWKLEVTEDGDQPAGRRTGGGIEARDKEKAHLGSPPPCDSGPLLACAQRLEARRSPVSSSFPLLATERLQIQGAQSTFIR